MEKTYGSSKINNKLDANLKIIKFVKQKMKNNFKLKLKKFYYNLSL